MKTKQQLTDKGDEIIDSLKDFKVPEKFTVISNLFYSLQDVMLKEGYAIVEKEKK